ncbi:MAG: TraR/DksA family transcriptional regulator [Castellaniella sp.]|nr:TraR/DksA family transcriptional regulator [Castellaniella sp.]
MSSNTDSTLRSDQIAALKARMEARKTLLMTEIRDVTNRAQRDFDIDLISRSGNPGAAATADLLRGISETEVRRDIEEVRDLVAAEQRIEAGRYGLCTDCGSPIGYKRLDAYPSAKRCYSCQVDYEAQHASRGW